MLKMSRERIGQLSRLIVDEVARNPSSRLLRDREAVRQSVIHTILEELKHDQELEEMAKQRLVGLKDAPPIGSKEWETAFRRVLEQLYDEDTGL